MDIVSSFETSVVPLQYRGPAEVSTSGYGSTRKPVEVLVRLEDATFAQTNIGNQPIPGVFPQQ
jgi:GH24 family phage-related lysozyme (muramidase)